MPPLARFRRSSSSRNRLPSNFPQREPGASVNVKTVSQTKFTRYVAIGDSQTEGLWDGDDDVGLIGYADRLAATLAALNPGLMYANLAVRGIHVRDALNIQLPRALAMAPDLITVCVGMNDIIRPGRSFDRALADLEQLYAGLAPVGATVLTTTFPDISRILPAARLLGSRLHRMNAAITTAARRHGFSLVDAFGAPSLEEPDAWSADFIHASTKGHTLFATAAAEALGLPGSNHDWAVPTGDPTQPTAAARAHTQLRWAREVLIPWLWRISRGRSSGDGRTPKRPRMQPVATAPGPGSTSQGHSTYSGSGWSSRSSAEHPV